MWTEEMVLLPKEFNLEEFNCKNLLVAERVTEDPNKKKRPSSVSELIVAKLGSAVPSLLSLTSQGF